MTQIVSSMESRGCLLAFGLLTLMTATAFADDGNSACGGLPSQATLQATLASATNAKTSGLNMNMWGTIVNRDGSCAPLHSPASIVELNGPAVGAISAEGEHRKLIQPRSDCAKRREWWTARVIDSESLLSRSAGWNPFRAAGEQSGGPNCRLQRAVVAVWNF